MLTKPHEQNTLNSSKLVLTSSSESDELLEESELDEEEEDEDNLTKHNKKWSLWDAAFCLANSQKSIQTLSSFTKYYQWNFTSKKLVLQSFN